MGWARARAAVVLGLTLASIAGCGGGGGSSDATPTPTPAANAVDVHFAVLTQRSAALAAATEAQMHTEVDILNRYFVGADGSHPVQFNYKGTTFAADVSGACPTLTRLGDARAEYDYNTLMAAYTGCGDARLVDPKAINIYVYDSYTRADGFDDITSHGIHNDGHPLILLDWERLNHTTQSPEEHEMGHAFGLGHVCVPGAGYTTPTNIMTSFYDCDGGNGLRNLGFTPEQLATIRAKLAVIQQAFATTSAP
ncbi:MAG: metalloprotease [Rhodoferax sp.]